MAPATRSTNGIALQAATSPYANITVSGNYISGFGYSVDICHETTGSTHLTFTNNVLATDLQQPTNTWSGNKLKVAPGTSPISGAWMWTPQEDGQYLWPDASVHTSDF